MNSSSGFDFGVNTDLDGFIASSALHVYDPRKHVPSPPKPPPFVGVEEDEEGEVMMHGSSSAHEVDYDEGEQQASSTITPVVSGAAGPIEAFKDESRQPGLKPEYQRP